MPPPLSSLALVQLLPVPVELAEEEEENDPNWKNEFSSSKEALGSSVRRLFGLTRPSIHVLLSSADY